MKRKKRSCLSQCMPQRFCLQQEAITNILCARPIAPSWQWQRRHQYLRSRPSKRWSASCATGLYPLTLVACMAVRFDASHVLPSNGPCIGTLEALQRSDRGPRRIVPRFSKSCRNKRATKAACNGPRSAPALLRKLTERHISSFAATTTITPLPLSVLLAQGWEQEVVQRFEAVEKSETYGCDVYKVPVTKLSWKDAFEAVEEKILQQEKEATKRRRYQKEGRYPRCSGRYDLQRTRDRREE